MNRIKLFTLALILLTTLSNATSEQQAIDLLNKVRNDLNSLSANFDQYEIFEDDIIGEASSGKVWLNSPNQFKWEYIDPAPQLIIADGSQVWIYDEDLEQVTIKQQDTKQNPIYVLLSKQDMESNYTLTIEENKDQESSMTWVLMQPKEDSDEIKLVWLGIQKDQLAVIKLQNQMDNIVVFEFNDINKNPEIEEGFFSFVAPEGTDIIQDSVAN